MKTNFRPLIVAIVTVILALAVTERALTFISVVNAGSEVDVSAELNSSPAFRNDGLEMSLVLHKGLYYRFQYKLFDLISISLSNMPGTGSNRIPCRAD